MNFEINEVTLSIITRRAAYRLRRLRRSSQLIERRSREETREFIDSLESRFCFLRPTVNKNNLLSRNAILKLFPSSFGRSVDRSYM